MQQQQPYINPQYLGQSQSSQPLPSPSGSAPNSASQAGLMMPANLAAMAQQGYAQQRARLAQMQAAQQGQGQGQGGQPLPAQGGVARPGGPQWAQQGQGQNQAFPMGMQQGMNIQQLQAMQLAMQQRAAAAAGGTALPGGGGGVGVPGQGGMSGNLPGMGGQLGSLSALGRPPSNQAALQNMLLQQQQFQQQQQAQQHHGSHHSSGTKKKKHHRPSPAHSMFPQHRPPPHTADLYRQQAMAPPHVAPPHGPPGSIPGPHAAPPRPEDLIEPWTDLVDEIDPKELAMARFRGRQEVMTEIFGPEPTNSIPLSTVDPWDGLGMSGETLEAKVQALEEENDKLVRESETRLEEWQARLNEIDEREGGGLASRQGMEVEVA